MLPCQEPGTCCSLSLWSTHNTSDCTLLILYNTSHHLLYTRWKHQIVDNVWKGTYGRTISTSDSLSNSCGSGLDHRKLFTEGLLLCNMVKLRKITWACLAYWVYTASNSIKMTLTILLCISEPQWLFIFVCSLVAMKVELLNLYLKKPKTTERKLSH